MTFTAYKLFGGEVIRSGHIVLVLVFTPNLQISVGRAAN
jgi:hypothetical protein